MNHRLIQHCTHRGAAALRTFTQLGVGVGPITKSHTRLLSEWRQRSRPSRAEMAQGAELSVLFDDGCVVVNDVEYWCASDARRRAYRAHSHRVPPNTDVSKVGTLVAFLEQQEGLRGKGKVVPYSAKKRKIVTNSVRLLTGARRSRAQTSSSMVAYVVLEQEGAKEEKKEEPAPAQPDPQMLEDADSAERLARLERVRFHPSQISASHARALDPQGSRCSRGAPEACRRSEGTGAARHRGDGCDGRPHWKQRPACGSRFAAGRCPCTRS